jgi:hypothetical protein
MESSTEILRRMLDERGVEYDTDDLWNHAQKHDSTSWKCDNGKLANFSEIDYPHMMKLRIYDCTPEQAIAVTLGSDREKELIALVLEMRNDMYQTMCDMFTDSGWGAPLGTAYDERIAALGI